MNPATTAILAGINGFLAVAAGAFGAHGLRSIVGSDALAVFDAAARYQMVHALAMIGLATLARNRPSRSWSLAATCFQGGILLFSGSLYAMGLSDLRWKWLAPVTPIGGGLFLLGWLMIVVGACRMRDRSTMP